jgi:hypothetical protein
LALIQNIALIAKFETWVPMGVLAELVSRAQYSIVKILVVSDEVVNLSIACVKTVISVTLS